MTQQLSAFFRQTCLRIVIACLAVCLSSAINAQESNLRLPISLDADSTDYDGKSSMLMFTGLRLTQGNIGVEADRGRATQLDFESSVWHFDGNVVFDVAGGHMESDSAELSFEGYQLRTATIKGSPATFVLTREGSEQITEATADELVYRLDTGVIEFSGSASINEGGNQISSNYLLYDLAAQRINATSGDDSNERVRIIYQPDEATTTESPEQNTDPSDEDTGESTAVNNEATGE